MAHEIDTKNIKVVENLIWFYELKMETADTLEEYREAEDKAAKLKASYKLLLEEECQQK